jgi:two-component system, OmpR family, sensor histidine kinase CiaH
MKILARPRARSSISEPAVLGDARLLRGVRRRLVAWSGAITLAILLVLGGAIYFTTARNLAAVAEGSLKYRADTVRSALAGAPSRPEGRPPDFFRLGFALGGPASGSFALIVAPSNTVIVPPDIPLQGLPVADGIEAARTSGSSDLRTASLGGVPCRVLSDPVDLAGSRYVVQVIADRTAEQQTLATLLTVLGVGGLAAMALALAGGWLYARRALVPIRDSLRRQREFAADASHELRTPLTVLRASVDDLRRHADQPVASVGSALDDMGAEVEHMTDLVDGLLTLARADSGVLEIEHEPIDLADAATSALGELSPLAATRGVTLALDAQPTPVSGDPTRLHQLATILVDNAIRHAGGPAQVKVSVRRDGGTALLEVEDTGPGIRDEDLPHVFDRFWRATDAPPDGLGLGLSIASWIAERHGGSISASARPGGGARFEVNLPASA